MLPLGMAANSSQRIPRPRRMRRRDLVAPRRDDSEPLAMNNFAQQVKNCLLKRADSIGPTNSHIKRMRALQIQWQFLNAGMAAKEKK